MKLVFPLFCGALLAALSTASAQLDGILAPIANNAPAAETRRATAPAKTASMRLGEAEIFQRIARKLTERLALDDGELTISPVAAWTRWTCPPGPGTSPCSTLPT